jgi:hypothetical protein
MSDAVGARRNVIFPPLRKVKTGVSLNHRCQKVDRRSRYVDFSETGTLPTRHASPTAGEGGHRAMPVVVLGHHLLEVHDHRAVLKSVHDPGCLEPQDHGRDRLLQGMRSE